MASPDKKAFLLRLPPEVWAQLERLAAAELRSVNGQIEYLLREGLARRMAPGTAEQDGSKASRGTSEPAPATPPPTGATSRRPQRHRK